jgi:type IV pilus assembly protein PilQ
MKMKFRFLIKKPVIFGLSMGLLWFLISGWAWAFSASQLKSLDIRPLPANKVELLLEFSGDMPNFQNFSVENPSTVVFDFPSATNGLSKELSNQTIGVGVLKNINIVEGDDRTRMVIELQHLVPFRKEVNGQQLKITLEGSMENQNIENTNALKYEKNYQIKSFDFRRGERGEGRLVVNLSTSMAAIDFKDSNEKMIVNFVGAKVADRLTKKYDVTDFATPVQSIMISKNGSNVNMLIEAVGEYDKIMYQMDNQFIVEVRSIRKDEKQSLKALSGQYSGERISLNFQDIEIRALLQMIADFSGFNIITSDSMKGNVTLRLQNVPWDQALDIILKTKGLDKRQYGNVMLVGPSDEIAAREKVELEGRKQIEELGALRSELIQINYAKAKELAVLMKDKANSIMTARGNVTVDERTNTLLVQDTENKLLEIRALLKKLDVPVRQVEISTQIVTATNTLENTLGMRFGGAANLGIGHRRLGVGSTVDRARPIADFGLGPTNTNPAGTVPLSNVEYNAPPPIVTTGAAAQQPPQPPDANITQGAYNGTPPTVNNTEGLFSDLGAITSGTLFGAAGITPGKVGFALGRLPNGTLLDLELQAMEFESKSKTIAKPKLITLDKNKASVEQGVDIPYLQASSSGATSVAYKTAALKLEVTPQITPDNKINLDLMISNDSVGAVVAAGPQVNTNRLQTKVLVDNGETIVLGGVLSMKDTKQSGKVPFFGDLPIIGGLFRNKFSSYTPSELIVFLTPKIINPPQIEEYPTRGEFYSDRHEMKSKSDALPDCCE